MPINRKAGKSTEHVHELVLLGDDRCSEVEIVCNDMDCGYAISPKEYDKLKRATDALRAEDVRKMVIISDDDWAKATLRAYADILEGK